MNAELPSKSEVIRTYLVSRSELLDPLHRFVSGVASGIPVAETRFSAEGMQGLTLRAWEWEWELTHPGIWPSTGSDCDSESRSEKTPLTEN